MFLRSAEGRLLAHSRRGVTIHDLRRTAGARKYTLNAPRAGGDASYSVVAGLFPNVAVALVNAVRNGDADEARRLNVRLQPRWSLFQEFSSLRVIYACVDLLGICHAAPPRPILPLAGLVRQRVADALEILAPN